MLKQIKILCQKHGISLAALERSTGIGNGTIARWENSSPQIDSVLKVANYFGVSIDYLLDMVEISPEAYDFAAKFDDLSQDEKKLVTCYMDIIRKK